MDEKEWQTRRKRIDTRLRAMNPPWEIVPWRDGLATSTLARHAVTEIPTANGPADYGFFVNGIFLGITEAKKVTVNPQNVLEQAKRYAAPEAHPTHSGRGSRTAGPHAAGMVLPSMAGD